MLPQEGERHGDQEEDAEDDEAEGEGGRAPVPRLRAAASAVAAAAQADQAAQGRRVMATIIRRTWQGRGPAGIATTSRNADPRRPRRRENSFSISTTGPVLDLHSDLQKGPKTDPAHRPPPHISLLTIINIMLHIT